MGCMSVPDFPDINGAHPEQEHRDLYGVALPACGTGPLSRPFANRTSYLKAFTSSSIPSRCWICGSPATTGEHKIKRADITRAYGRGPYKGPSRPLHFNDGVQSTVQGPNSSRLKYAPSLCAPCNNSRTQPFDKAYDCFASWIQQNAPQVLINAKIDWIDIFGTDSAKGPLSLFKYFVKSFCCRLVHAGYPAPQDLIDLIVKGSLATNLTITFCINDSVIALIGPSKWGYLGKGELTGFYRRAHPKEFDAFEWSENLNWLEIFYWYNRDVPPGLGDRWFGSDGAARLNIGRLEHSCD